MSSRRRGLEVRRRRELPQARPRANDVEGRAASRQVGRAVRRDERPDPLQVLVGHAWIPLAHPLDVDELGRAEIELLEQPVHGRADVERADAVLSLAVADRLERAHPHEALGVVAVRAAVERRDRGERQAPDPRERGHGNRRELRQPRGRAHGWFTLSAEQRQLSRLLPEWQRLTWLLGLGRVSVDADEDPRAAALQLQRLAAGLRELLPRVEPLEHPADRRRALARPLGVDRAGDDQAVDRTRHRHVVETQPLCVLGALPLGANLVVARRSLEAEAAVRQREDLVGRRWLPVAAASATTTTLNSSPFAAWIVSSRT